MMLGRINALTETIFGDIFYQRGAKQVSLIQLRDDLFGYIDDKHETNPDGVQEFIQALDADPLTAHFSAILRTE
jgi:hypothetical protein